MIKSWPIQKPIFFSNEKYKGNSISDLFVLYTLKQNLFAWVLWKILDNLSAYSL